jgi:hydroxylysine kinase
MSSAPELDPEKLHSMTPLLGRSPGVSVAEAERVADEHYGIKAKADRLAGEKDENFRLAADGASYLLKIFHVVDRPEVANLATCALIHLENVAADLPVQRIVRTLHGEPELHFRSAGGEARTARMTSFIDGRMLATVPSNRALREDLGKTLARIGHALQTFEHPGAHRPLLWDLQHAGLVRPLLEELDGLQDHALLAYCLDRFQADVCPRLSELRTQIVHNDLSGDNTVVADDGETVAGVIDFGDMTATQIINDVAVAASNQVVAGDDPIGPAIDLVRGYHGLEPLTVAELEILYDLVRTRIAVRIIIAEFRGRRFPENRTYIVRNLAHSWSLLDHMPADAAPDVAERLVEHCHPRDAR